MALASKLITYRTSTRKDRLKHNALFERKTNKDHVKETATRKVSPFLIRVNRVGYLISLMSAERICCQPAWSVRRTIKW